MVKESSDGENVKYTKIKYLSNEHFYNIICKILDIYPWKKSKGEDFVMTLKVSDDPKEDFLFVKIFNRKKNVYGFSIGDIVKIHKIRYFTKSFYILDKEGSIIKTNSMDSNVNILQNESLVENFNFSIKKIFELVYSEYIKFIGMLIYKQKESDNLTILGFIDYTINKNIKKSQNKAFYENNMILYVRAWDKMAKDALNLEENTFYCVENLKIKVEITKICSDLSDNPLSKISEVTDEKVINEIKSRSNLPKDRIIKFSDQVYTSNKVFLIKNIKDPGYYKIQVKLIRHHPFKGQIIKICSTCGIVKENGNLKCKCGTLFDEFFVVKYLAKDESSECLLLCKNEVAKSMLKRCEPERSIELLVYCDYRKNKLFFEVKDLPNFVL